MSLFRKFFGFALLLVSTGSVAATLEPAFDPKPALPFDPNAVYSAAEVGRHLQGLEGIHPVVVQVRLLAAGPVYRFELIPDVPPGGGADPRRGFLHHVGKIVIRRGTESAVLQTLDVESWLDPDELLHQTTFGDVDFDGAPDLVLVFAGGAKWRSYRVYFFNPATGLFTADTLTADISEHGTSSEPLLDRAAREIAFDHLGSGSCQPGFVDQETFAMQGRHLTLVGQHRETVRGGTCMIETLRLEAGNMKVVGEVPEPHLPL